jgi:hypothetical protein
MSLDLVVSAQFAKQSADELAVPFVRENQHFISVIATHMVDPLQSICPSNFSYVSAAFQDLRLGYGDTKTPNLR